MVSFLLETRAWGTERVRPQDVFHTTKCWEKGEATSEREERDIEPEAEEEEAQPEV
jgi:hypothetical protein